MAQSEENRMGQDNNSEPPLEQFPRITDIKVMGLNDAAFENSIHTLVASIVLPTGMLGSTNKLSSNRKYTSVTLNVYVQSKQQLIDVYVKLRACDDVLYLL